MALGAVTGSGLTIARTIRAIRIFFGPILPRLNIKSAKPWAGRAIVAMADSQNGRLRNINAACLPART